MMRSLLIGMGLLAAAIGLSACQSRPDSGMLAPTQVMVAGATDHTVLIASTRQRDQRPNTLYDGERGALDYASVTVSVPPDHVSGHIEWPTQPPGDPAHQFVTRRAAYLDGAQGFDRALKQELAQRPKDHRDVVLFVHGYNTNFAEGLYRFVQLGHDARGSSVPVLFTWASRGSVRNYIYDLNSATAARDALETTLRQLAASGAEHIHIVAHSMGNWLTVETLRQMRISGKNPVEDKLGLVALAAPDIDVDVFKAQMRRYGKPKKPFIILLSRDDRALGLSTFIAGDKQRVGDYSNDAELAALGAIVVDLSGVTSNDDTNHWKFAQFESFSPELKATLTESGIALPTDIDAQRSSPVERIGTSLGSFVTSAANVVITLPTALAGQ